MLALGEAQRAVLDVVEPLPRVTCDLAESHGLALAEDVVAPHDVPPFANSAMDGFAVLATDVARTPVDLEIIEDVAAGNVAAKAVTAGSAVRIMTGAPMPAGADTVVPVEDSETDGSTVRLLAGRPSGANVRAAGGDLRAGDLVMEAGTRIDATKLAVLASLGISPTVRRRPVVAIFSTGDELRSPQTRDLEPGAIRDSNRPLIHQLLLELGCDVQDLGIVPDDAQALRGTLEHGFPEADLIVSSGGVSMGDRDLVRQVIGDIGSVDLWKVAVKPGKPFAFGRVAGRPFFGLPGNPVSVFVSFEQFVRPAILTMLGARLVFRVRTQGQAMERLDGDPVRVTFARVAVGSEDGGGFVVRSAGGQGSNILTALSRADAFAVIPPGADVGAGERVELEMFRWPEGRSREEASV